MIGGKNENTEVKFSCLFTASPVFSLSDGAEFEELDSIKQKLTFVMTPVCILKSDRRSGIFAAHGM